MPTGHPIPLDLEAIKDLYDRGLSCRQIAEELDTNHSTILQRLRKLEVPRRSQQEAQRGRHAGPSSHVYATIRVTTACAQCGKPMAKLPHEVSGRQFCSRSCYGRYRSVNKMGGPVPQPAELTEVECHSCGRPFEVSVAEAKRGRRFCSQICAWKFNHNARWGVTVPERIIQALLTGMSIHFIPEWTLGIRRADIYLPGCNVAIECDGDYWHSLPHSQRAQQRKAQDFDAAGIETLHLRELAIREDLLGCKAQIEDLLRRHSNRTGTPPIPSAAP